MKFEPTILAMLLTAACNSGADSGGSADPDANDQKQYMDAPPIVASSITITGKTTERSISGESAVAGVTMAAHASSNEATTIVSTMSDAQGNYTLTVMTNGMPLDGFIKATKSGYVDLYMYPTSPFIADFPQADVNMMTPSNKDFLNSLASGNQMAGKGLIGLQVRDASGQPVAGATVSSTPASGAYRYTGSNGLPSGSATSTSADGVAFMFNVPDGNVTVTAAKAGITFKAHMIKARADKFTTTSIAP